MVDWPLERARHIFLYTPVTDDEVELTSEFTGLSIKNHGPELQVGALTV